MLLNVQEETAKVLGNQGREVLNKVVGLIEDSASRFGWPIKGIEVRYTRDPEVEGWEYVLLVLEFSCPFEEADKHLHVLYNQLDALSAKLAKDEKLFLQRLIFFDIETAA